MKSVTIKVPASTSNLGSGFDTLGLALKLYTTVRVTRIAGMGIVIAAPLAGKDGMGAKALAAAIAVEQFFRQARVRPFAVEVFSKSDVPVARGLGYSATIRVGVLAALNQMTGARLSRNALLKLATELEGHHDNASPAIFGGFTVSGAVGSEVRCLRFPVSPQVKFVTLIPRLMVETGKARELIPKTYSNSDTRHGLNRAALITAAFASGDYVELRGLFDDRVHQPYREKLIPQLSKVIKAGEQAGAIGGFLSGSGSSIICVTLERSEGVAAAMKMRMPKSEVKILTSDNSGFRLAR